MLYGSGLWLPSVTDTIIARNPIASGDTYLRILRCYISFRDGVLRFLLLLCENVVRIINISPNMDVNIMSATPTHSPRPSSPLTSPTSASVGSAAHKLRHVLSFDTLCDKSQDAAMATGPIIDPQKRLALPKKPNLLQDAIGEFFGTFVMILLGEGISAQVLLSHNTKGDWQSIIWGWG